MKNIFSGMVLSACLLASAHAQTLTNAEYFFDTDPGLGNGTAIPVVVPGDSVIQPANISLAGLPPGPHLLVVRTKNAGGTWALSNSKSFYVNDAIVAPLQFQIYLAEYFIDTDPGQGNGTPVVLIAPGDTVSQQLSFSTSGLPAGPHIFTIRTKDVAGTWSHQVSRNFFISEALPAQQVASAEYFFDSDPGPGNGIPLTLPAGGSVSTALSVTNPFSSGQHTFVLRTKNVQGTWSHQLAQPFQTCSTYGANSDFTYFVDRRTVYFNNISQYDTAFQWNFGDAFVTSTQRNPVHTYAAAGNYTVSLISYNGCATDTFHQLVPANGLQSISPSLSADTNFFIGHIRGIGFDTTSVVRLKRGATSLLADSTIYISSTDLKVLFKFNHPPIGKYDVIATNISGPLDTLTGAFTIESRRPVTMSMFHAGLARVRTGRTSPQSFTIRNDGNVTLFMVPVFFFFTDSGGVSVRISNNITVDPSVPASIIPLVPPYHEYPIQDPYNPQGPSLKIVSALIPYIDPGGEVTLQTDITAPTPGCRELTVKVGSPMAEGFINPLTNSCKFLPAPVKCVMDVLGLFPGTGCVTGALNFGCTVGDVVNDVLWDTHRIAWYDIAANWGGMVLGCVGSQTANTAIQIGVAGATSLSGAVGSLADCNDAINDIFPDPPQLPVEKASVCFGNSYDPNEKTGPEGITSDNYINKNGAVSYHVAFENSDTASAPAAVVRISDRLDTATLDLSTFRFTQVGFGDTVLFAPPEYAADWVEDIDLRTSHGIWLRINGTLDTLTGVLNWTFSSYDTTTFDVVTDPALGFLPPNVTSPQGEGFIAYEVKPKPGLHHGDRIVADSAAIIFDNNSPILTNAWLNTIDTIQPSSNIQPLIATQVDSTFMLHVNGSDAHAGILDYMIYASVNGSVFTPVAFGLPYDSMQFTGINGNQYEFFSQARDRAGNVEDTVHVSDAVTVIAVGMEELPEHTSLDIYPNPSAAEISILIHTDKPATWKATLYTMEGKKSAAAELKSNEKKFISLHALSSGMYYLKIENDAKQYLVKKIIILK